MLERCWTHIWRCEATTVLCTDYAIPPTSFHVTALAVLQSSNPTRTCSSKTCHASLGSSESYCGRTGWPACNLAPISKERRHAPAVRQTFSDFFRLVGLLIRLRSRLAFFTPIWRPRLLRRRETSRDLHQLSKPRQRGQQSPDEARKFREFLSPPAGAPYRSRSERASERSNLIAQV